MEATTQAGPEPIGAGAEPIESMEWLRGFAERYLAAWNGHSPDAVAAHVSTDVVWTDPALPEQARGREGVAKFARESFTAFPDATFSSPGEPAIADGGLAAYVPWMMIGTNTGPIDPPGFAPTGKRVEVRGMDVWQFRGGLIWRYEAIYDFANVAAQLGLIPASGSFTEKAMVRAQRLRSRLSG